ncbi:MAG: hypothetical protein AAFV62_03065 [Pseudomonadota bacterium]
MVAYATLAGSSLAGAVPSVADAGPIRVERAPVAESAAPSTGTAARLPSLEVPTDPLTRAASEQTAIYERQRLADSFPEGFDLQSVLNPLLPARSVAPTTPAADEAGALDQPTGDVATATASMPEDGSLLTDSFGGLGLWIAALATLVAGAIGYRILSRERIDKNLL